MKILDNLGMCCNKVLKIEETYFKKNVNNSLEPKALREKEEVKVFHKSHVDVRKWEAKTF